MSFLTLLLDKEDMYDTLYCALSRSAEETPYLRAFIDTARTVSFRTLKGIQPI